MNHAPCAMNFSFTKNHKLKATNYLCTMQKYQPVPRAVYEAVEELYLLKQPANFTFEQNFARKTVLNIRVIDLHQEDEGEYLTLEGGLHLRLNQLVAINGKPVQYFV